MTGYLTNMIARASGAYAFTDYASAWGLNNLANTGYALGMSGSGMGLAGLNFYSTWGQMYPIAPMFGYSTDFLSNPFINQWPNFSGLQNYSLTGYYPYNNYNLYYPYNNYNLGYGNYPSFDFSLLNSITSTAAQEETTEE